MSKITQWLSRMGALREFVARVRSQCPKLVPLLDALQADDHRQAWDTFAAYSDVAAVLEHIPPTAKPYVSIIGPYLMEALDVVVDEEEVKALMERLGLMREEDPPTEHTN